MYRLKDYRDMILDDVRRAAYVGAIRDAVRPGARVIELGTGFGYFAVVACRAGAASVVAIEPNAAIHLGRELARANGCEDRIEWVREVSTRVSVPPGDVLVSDLRGVLPLAGAHIPAIIDARRRLLVSGGVQIPAWDRLWAALVREEPGTDATRASVGGAGSDVELAPLDETLSHQWRSRTLMPGDLMSPPTALGTIDYRTVTTPDFDTTIELAASESAGAAGLGVWFDTELSPGRTFSTVPGGPETVYGHAYFPFPAAIPLARGDGMVVRLRAKLVGSEYVWTWEGTVVSGASAGRAFVRSTFHGQRLDAPSLRKRGDRFVPRLGREGAAHSWILTRMGADASVGDIARGAAAEFPDVFPDAAEALRCVGDLSQRFSE